MLSLWLFVGLGCTHIEDAVMLGTDVPGQFLSTEFSLLTWNVGKGQFADAKTTTSKDLKTLLDAHDIGCIQEFVPSLTPAGSGVFARSFRWWLSDEPNGVATFSKTGTTPGGVNPVPSGWSEGWIMTPKMSLLTTYRLPQTELLVANVHALNFQPVFTYMLSSQLGRIREHVSAHDGPVIVCGDFNTWREDRLLMVRTIFNDFEAVTFSPDDRSRGGIFARFAGDASLALDHVFVKGLEIIDSEVLPLESSDHRPLAVRLRFVD